MDRLEKILKDKLRQHQIKEGVPSWDEMEKALNSSGRSPFPRTSLLSSPWVRWSAAAVFILWVGIGALYWFEKQEEPTLATMAGERPPVSAVPETKPEKGAVPESLPVESFAETTLQTVSPVPVSSSAELLTVSDSSGISPLLPDHTEVSGPLLAQEKEASLPETSSEKVRPSPRERGSESPEKFLWPEVDIPSSLYSGQSRLWAISLFANPDLLQDPLGVSANSLRPLSSPVFTEVDWTSQVPEVNISQLSHPLPEVNTSQLSHRMPLSFGLLMRRSLTNHLSVETGLVYTYLRSDSEMTGSLTDYKYRQNLHYLGIPLSFSSNILKNNLFRIYVSGGGMAEMAFAASGYVDLYSQGSRISRETVHLNARGVVLSLQGTTGIEYRFLKNTGFYVEPGFSFYPRHTHQPPSFRTDHPLIFNLRIGFRKEI